MKKVISLITEKAHYSVRVGFWELLISQVFVQGGSYILQLVVAIIVGPELFANIRISESWIALIILPAAVGVPASVIKYVSEKPYLKNSILISGLSIVTVSSCLIAAITFAIIGQIASPEIASIIKILAWSLVLSNITRTILAYLQGLKNFKKVARVNIVTSISGIGITIATTYFWGIAGWLLGRLVSEGLFTILTIIFTREHIHFKNLELSGKYTDKLKLSGKMIRMGIFSMLTLLVARVIQQGDIILLAFSLNNKELIGNYSIATILRIGLTLPVGVLGSILLPYMVTRINSKYQVAKFLFTSLLYGLAILTPICILVLFLPNMVMSNYFSKYLIITHYLVILLPALIFDSLNTLLNNFIVAFGRTELSFGIYAISCVSHILLSILLISNLGIHGIMISLGITYIQIFIISVAVLATLIKRNNLAEADLSNSNYL